MRVDAKICGLTRPEDAALAVQLGAWRLGVIFAGGPRVVAPSRAREIVAAASGTPVLGVFGSESFRTMLEVIRSAGLAGAQLHGAQPPEVAQQLRSEGLEVWRVVAIDDATDLELTLRPAMADVDAVLLEARAPGGAGGKGIRITMAVARQARDHAAGVRVVLAGGLTPDSVEEAIQVVRPDAVDVSSGVESSPGIKDHDRLARFLEIVRATRSTD